MAARPGTRGRVSDINVTPLVDVVLVLLITFMVMTPLAEKQMPVRVPEAEQSTVPVPPDQVPPDQVLLTVRADARVVLDRRDMSVEQAMSELHGAFAGRASKVLFFNAEDGVSYELAMSVLDRARQAGVVTIGMVTDPPARGSVAGPR